MTTLSLSARANRLQPSPTLSVTAKANAMKAAGQPVISFAAGEPDFATPLAIREATTAAMNAGFTKYSPTIGLPALREAIAEKLKRENGLSLETNQICVNNGAKQSIFNALQVLINPGEEVILIAPFWATYEQQVELAGGKPVIVYSDPETHIPTLEAIKEAITEKTRAILINSPCNPTGAVFPREIIKGIAALALRHGLWIISDEIYERLTYGTDHTCLAALGKDIAEQTITVGGCSKSYAMTGWRVGFAAGPKQVIEKIAEYQEQVTSNVNTFVQKGAIVAFGLPASEVETMRAEFEVRRNLMADGLRTIPGVTFSMPQGAFYHFASFSSYAQQHGGDSGLAQFLLEKSLVATIPGSAFYAPGFLRLSYATSREAIEEGMNRIREALIG